MEKPFDVSEEFVSEVASEHKAYLHELTEKCKILMDCLYELGDDEALKAFGELMEAMMNWLIQ